MKNSLQPCKDEGTGDRMQRWRLRLQGPVCNCASILLIELLKLVPDWDDAEPSNFSECYNMVSRNIFSQNRALVARRRVLCFVSLFDVIFSVASSCRFGGLSF